MGKYARSNPETVFSKLGFAGFPLHLHQTNVPKWYLKKDTDRYPLHPIPYSGLSQRC